MTRAKYGGRLDRAWGQSYDRPMTTALIGALLLALQGAQSPTVRIDSREQGRTFYVDPDDPEIRKALRDVSASLPAGPMPAWATPPADAKPWGQPSPNAPVEFGVATYSSSAPPDSVVAYFESRAARDSSPSGTTTASVADVTAFYRETFSRNGLIILTESQTQDRYRFIEARSPDRMHRISVSIRQRPRDTHVRLMDHYTLPPP